jgi:hypothetical protein
LKLVLLFLFKYGYLLDFVNNNQGHRESDITPDNQSKQATMPFRHPTPDITINHESRNFHRYRNLISLGYDKK